MLREAAPTSVASGLRGAKTGRASVGDARSYRRIVTAPRSPVTAAEATEQLGDPWRVMADAAHASFRTGNMVTGGTFVVRIIDASERADRHPDIDLRYGAVHIRLSTHSNRSTTRADVAPATTIAAIAAELTLAGTPAPFGRVDIDIAALDIAARTLLAGGAGLRDEPEHHGRSRGPRRHPADGVVSTDGHRATATQPHPRRPMGFPMMRSPLMAAVIAAGGHLVSDEFAPECVGAGRR